MIFDPFEIDNANEQIRKKMALERARKERITRENKKYGYKSFYHGNVGRVPVNKGKENSTSILREIKEGKRQATLNKVICKLSINGLDTDMYYRQCLRCEEKFVAKGKFMRLCNSCHYQGKGYENSKMHKN